MKRFFLYIMVGGLIFVGSGCGSVRKVAKSTLVEQEETLIAPEEAAIIGEDIPLTELPEDEFVEPESVGVEGIFEDIHFDFDKAIIRPVDQPVLDRIAEWLKQHPEVNLMIEGHCDERGSNEYNMALGEQRALSVRRYLISLGIEPNRLFTISYGEEKPIDPRHNEEAWAKNRRAHFRISR